LVPLELPQALTAAASSASTGAMEIRLIMSRGAGYRPPTSGGPGLRGSYPAIRSSTSAETS
jgi:hypothetical protein